ncbi:MAG: phosphatase PAP2 family protein [Methanobacteriota archaeon]
MDLDAVLLSAANDGLAHPLLDATARALSVAGAWIAWVLVAALVSLRYRRLGVLLLVTIVLAVGTVHLAKEAAGRERPQDVRDVLDPPESASFPSGHATTAMAVAWVAGRHLRRRAVWIVLASYAILQGAFRVYAGVHYPSDVVAGFAIGLAIGEAVIRASRVPTGAALLDRVAPRGPAAPR